MTATRSAAEAAGAIRAAAAPLTQDWIEPPVLQPADVYLELAGEDLRARAYLLEGDDGLCVRPDMTAPAVRMALQRASWDAPFGVGYDGLVFRRRDSEHDDGEFRQVGVECFDRATDLGKREASLVACALDACRAMGVSPRLRLGDTRVFNALVESADLSPGWTRRIKRAFARPDALTRVLAEAAKGAEERTSAPSLARALAGLDAGDCERIVSDLLDDARIPLVGARTVGEIAARLRSKGGEDARTPSRAQVDLISQAVSLNGSPGTVLAALEKLSHSPVLHHPDVARAAIARAAERWAQLGTADADLSVGFGRGLAYYDGLVFELEAPDLGVRRSLGGGGRYDGLLHRLADRNASRAHDLASWGAMGFALRPDRLAEASR